MSILGDHSRSPKASPRVHTHLSAPSFKDWGIMKPKIFENLCISITSYYRDTP